MANMDFKNIIIFGLLFLAIFLPTSFSLEDLENVFCKLNGDCIVEDLNVTGHFYNKMPHLYGISDTAQNMVAINTWQNLTFNFSLGDNYGFTTNGDCIVVSKTGHYIANYELHLVDDSPSPDSYGAIRITQNGNEVSGSYSQISFTRQSAEIEITTFGYIEAIENDILCMQWIGDDIDIRVFESNTWAEQPIMGKGFINWVHP